MSEWLRGDDEMVERIRAFDWAATPLGPIDAWPASLRIAVNLVLGSPVASILLWRKEFIQIYNAHWRDLMGNKHPQALGQATHLTFPEIAEAMTPLYDRAIRGEAAVLKDTLLPVERNGVVHDAWWDVHYLPVRDESGEVAGLLCNVMETTKSVIADRERADAVASLWASDARHAFLLGLSDALRAQREESAIAKSALRTLSRELGLDRCYIVHVDLLQGHATIRYQEGNLAIPPLPDEIELSMFPHALRTFLDHTLVIDDINQDPRLSAEERESFVVLKAASLIAPPLRSGADNPVWAVVAMAAQPRHWTTAEIMLIEEASERIWSAIEHARADKALREADRRKDEFLAVLGHELRNGLAPLVYNMQIANRIRSDEARLAGVFASMDRQFSHIVRLVDDLLDVSRISTGQIALSREMLKARDVVALAIDASRADIDRKRHVLTVIDESDANLTIHGDRVRLTQVISNLLSNAAKYMDDGGKITCRLSQEGDDVVVEIRDIGIGIPASALPYVFDLFTQVRKQQTHSTVGLGIGLSLVRDLVAMHDGSVSVISDGPGQGSTFYVRLPAVRAATGSQVPATEPGDTDLLATPLHVLIVDDFRDAADALAQLLQLEGVAVEVAYDGAHALECVQKQRPDLVLLDLGMPGMDGFEVLRRMRELSPAEPRLRIVALTGWGQIEDRRLTTDAGFDDHIAKPPRESELREILSAARQARGD